MALNVSRLPTLLVNPIQPSAPGELKKNIDNGMTRMQLIETKEVVASRLDGYIETQTSSVVYEDFMVPDLFIIPTSFYQKTTKHERSTYYKSMFQPYWATHFNEAVTFSDVLKF